MVLKKIIGRQDQLMHFPDRVRAATGLDQKLMRENLNALVFQLAQIAAFKLKLRFVPMDASKQFNAGPITPQS